MAIVLGIFAFQRWNDDDAKVTGKLVGMLL
jgi:hypothetical protein